MRDLTTLLALPAALLAFIATSGVTAQELVWPHSPEHEAHVKRELEIQQRLAWHAPSGIRKMRGDDEGEKFFLHYWDFGEELATNTSIPPPALSAAIAPHTNHDRHAFNLFGRSNIFARAFQCPADTVSCSSIGSDLCCPSGQTCVSVSSGVGCCPSGETCGDELGTCTAGYASCPNSSNGGCCIPGATCEGTGCVIYGSETVTVTAPTATVTSGVSYTTETGGSESTTVAIPVTPAVDSSVATSVQTSGYTTTVTVTQSISGQMTTIVSATTVIIVSTTQKTPQQTTTQQTTQPTSQTDSATTTTTTGGAAGAPIRPTSISSSSADTMVTAASAPSSSSSAIDSACPTGYYMCSAYYLGGCCRVGRNCDTTSCPTSDSTAVSSGATVVVPATTTGDAAATQGSCANGWASCPVSVGGGCCPSGYVCGASSCSATVSGESGTGKEAPSSASVIGWAWSFLGVGLVAGVGMVWL